MRFRAVYRPARVSSPGVSVLPPSPAGLARGGYAAAFREKGTGMSEIAVVAISVAKPGYEEQLRQALEGIVGPTRKEAGVLQYDLHRDVQEPRRFVFVERWESAEALAVHAKSAHIDAYRKAVADWVEHAEIRVVSKIA
jgi:quinol monooxygenase YgiN